MVYQRRTFKRKEESPDQHLLNKRIRASRVRLVGNNVTPGIYPIAEALRMAADQALDLVAVAVKEKEPVCKLMDYTKYRYQRKKKERVQKKANKVVEKEVRFAVNMGVHDLAFRKKYATKFLQEGASVKLSLRLGRGRDYSRSKIKAQLLMEELLKDMVDLGGYVKQPIKTVGRRMTLLIDPSPNR